MELWSSQSETVAGARARVGAAATAIRAVGIANQRETTLIWDRESGQPMYHAMVWQGRRAADLCARFRKDGLEPEVAARTGLQLDPNFSATKNCWLLDPVDGVRRWTREGRLLSYANTLHPVSRSWGWM